MQTPGDAPLTLDVRATDVGFEIVAVGEIDLSTADAFRDALAKAANGAGRVVSVDLSGIGFIDSTGLRSLSERWTGASGKRWTLVGVSAPVRRLMEMTGIADVFELDDTDTEATLAAARSELEDAQRRNHEAIEAGNNPPVGRGALLVLERRVDAAELRLRRERSAGDT